MTLVRQFNFYKTPGYIALEVTPHSRSYDTPFKLKAHSLYTTIINKIEQLYGDFGVAALKGGFIAKYCNEKTRVAFVRARHGPHRLLASCLPLITYIENHQVMLRILYTGATMRQCYKFIQQTAMSVKLERRASEGDVSVNGPMCALVKIGMSKSSFDELHVSLKDTFFTASEHENVELHTAIPDDCHHFEQVVLQYKRTPNLLGMMANMLVLGELLCCVGSFVGDNKRPTQHVGRVGRFCACAIELNERLT
uniref:Uncharacterized protein n=1 Tax=Timema monikensis TaxID=170555 RepID=A0A7R9DY82_9NEOP|nr:unnamed protein product [Timema monikensis]